MSTDLAAFHTTFFDEADALVGKAVGILTELGEGRRDGGALDELHRCVHGVAGGAATLGFADLAVLARSLEQCIDVLRNDGETITRVDLALCRRGLAGVRDNVGALRVGLEADVMSMERLCDRLRARSNGIQVDEAEDSDEPFDQTVATTPDEGRASGVPPAQAGQVLCFTVSRLLAGADVLVEHVLEELGRMGRITGVSHERADLGDRVYRITLEGVTDPLALLKVLDPIAEPGSIAVKNVDSEPSPRIAIATGAEPNASPGEAFNPDARRHGLPDRYPGDDVPVTGEPYRSFEAGDQAYLIAEKVVAAIGVYRGAMRMPGLPPFVLGVVGHEGEPVPLVDAWIALDPRNAVGDVDLAQAQILIVTTRVGPIALLVDHVGERQAWVRQEAIKWPRALRLALIDAPLEGFVFEPEAEALAPGRAVVDIDRLASHLDDLLAIRAGRASPGSGRDADSAKTDSQALHFGSSSATMSSVRSGGVPVRKIRRARPGGQTLEDEWGERGR